METSNITLNMPESLFAENNYDIMIERKSTLRYIRSRVRVAGKLPPGRRRLVSPYIRIRRRLSVCAWATQTLLNSSGASTDCGTMTMYCQKCRTPLKLDKSLEELNPAAFDLLVGMLTR